jgi:hypothetical protein
LILVSATALVTEWIHYRLGEPTVWRLLQSPTAQQTISIGSDDNPSSVTESEFEIYLRVLESMQADRSLSIEHAVETEHLTVESFRDIEQRVQKNDVLVERTRDGLRKKAETLWDSRRATLTSSPTPPS